jgi:hypothetical protein
MTREEADELLELVETVPTAPPVRYLVSRHGRPVAPAYVLMREFLAQNQLEPGGSPSIEVCSIYRFYLLWHARTGTELPPIPPYKFCLLLKYFRFKRRGRTQANGRDRRLIGMRAGASHRMRDWLIANPDTDAERRRFLPTWSPR